MKTALLVALMFGLGVGGYVMFTHLPPPVASSKPVQTLTGDTCQLDRGSCLLRSSSGAEATITLSPLPVPLMEEVSIKVLLAGFPAIHSGQVQIEGVNMFMGFQNAPLSPTATGLQGLFSLPLCSNATMHWQASIDLYGEDANFRAVLPFTTER